MVEMALLGMAWHLLYTTCGARSACSPFARPHRLGSSPARAQEKRGHYKMTMRAEIVPWSGICVAVICGGLFNIRDFTDTIAGIDNADGDTLLIDMRHVNFG